MAGRLAGATKCCARGVLRCGCVVPSGVRGLNLVTRGTHPCNRLLHVSCVGNFSNVVQTQHLQVQDDFFTHLHAGGQQMEGSLSLLLLLAARWNDHASIHHLLEQARTAGVRPSAYTMENVLNTYIKRKNLSAAVSLYGRLKREYVEASLESCTVLQLCTMLVESGKCLEALETLREFVQAGKRPEVSPKNAAESCKILLSKAAETGNYGLVKEMLDHLLLGNLVEPGPQVVAPLLQCQLDRGDVQGTVEVAEHIYRSYNTLPKRMEIFIKLMQHNSPMEGDLLAVLKRGGGQSRDEADLLGRMLDLAQDCYGPAQAHHDLLFACLESGHPAAARLVLQALAQDTDERLILRMCKIYAKNKREAALEHLLAASKGMTNIDRLKIYEILLDAYKLRGNKMGEETLSLWTSMQQEGLTPSSTFLATLAALLENSNMKIPSQVQ